ncbi:hypothetical protein GCM10010430_36100 [Kitasatospora cystarginea]|uniref:Uncharacterized protein n=1 Tax=Kitasatospora cystarginea TaxID=58350 RepID=A0ABN3E726_9ACTN
MALDRAVHAPLPHVLTGLPRLCDCYGPRIRVQTRRPRSVRAIHRGSDGPHAPGSRTARRGGPDPELAAPFARLTLIAAQGWHACNHSQQRIRRSAFESLSMPEGNHTFNDW